jgi:para-aminobenzoate synthetase/4-amino-4-deoxychorismate lyase
MAGPDASLGVFETLLVRDRAAQALDAHVERLRRSAERLYGLRAPLELPALIRERARQLDDGEHRMRADGALRLEFATTPLAPRPALWRLAPFRFPGGYGPDKLADRGPLTSSVAGGPVALLVDGDGPDADVLEAAWANVWLWDGRRLITPPCDGRILPGVTRARVIEHAPGLGLTVSEQPIRVAQLRSAAAAMLTSSLQLAAPAALHDVAEPGPDAVAVIARVRDALRRRDWDR